MPDKNSTARSTKTTEPVETGKQGEVVHRRPPYTVRNLLNNIIFFCVYSGMAYADPAGGGRCWRKIDTLF